MTKLNDEQLSAYRKVRLEKASFDAQSQGGLTSTLSNLLWNGVMCPTEDDYLDTIADLKRQLAERDRIAYPIIGIPSAKDFARQCDPFEPDSETTTGTCAHWRDKVEKVFAQVRSIFDAYVQEKVDDARIDEHTAYCNLCILKRECLRLHELRNRPKVKP